MARYNGCDRNNQRAQPTAPPIHLMPRSADQQRPQSQADNLQARDWGPPPRYDEAIAEDREPSKAAVEAAVAAATIRHNNLPTSQQSSAIHYHHQGRPSRFAPAATSDLAPSPSGRSQPSATNRRRQFGSETECNAAEAAAARYRSASPGGLSDNGARSSIASSAEANQEASNKKKRSSGSRIKKGLESIAFFIIQILD